MKIDGEENKVNDFNEGKDSQKSKSFENLQVDENHLEYLQMNNESEFITEDIPHEDEFNSAESSEQIKQHNEDSNSAHNDLINSNDGYEHQDGDEKANSLNQSQSEVHIEHKGDNSNNDNDSLFKHDSKSNANQKLSVKENDQNENDLNKSDFEALSNIEQSNNKLERNKSERKDISFENSEENKQPDLGSVLKIKDDVLKKEHWKNDFEIDLNSFNDENDAKNIDDEMPTQASIKNGEMKDPHKKLYEELQNPNLNSSFDIFIGNKNDLGYHIQNDEKTLERLNSFQKDKNNIDDNNLIRTNKY